MTAIVPGGHSAEAAPLSDADPDENVGPCAICGHDPACGFASVEGDWLCHADDHSCYFAVGVVTAGGDHG